MQRTTFVQASVPAIPPREAAALHAEDVVPGLPAPENKRFYPALDGLRAVAVLMVFAEHYFLALRRWPAIRWGWTGVDLFFVLSGFLITGILYDTRDTAHRFRNFYVRRTLRIFPLYYAVLLIALLLTPIFRWQWHPVLLLWPFYLSNFGRYIWLHDYLQYPGLLDHLLSTRHFQQPFSLFFGHFWSLCIEEQFYLVWPLIVYFVKDRVKLRNLCILICVLTPLARILCVKIVPNAYIQADLLFRTIPFRADALLFGGALALMLRGPEGEWIEKLHRHALWTLIAALALFELVWRLLHGFFFYPGAGGLLDPFVLSVVDLSAAIVILNCLYPHGFLYRFLNTPMLRRLGQVSYGFYLFHDIPHLAYSYLTGICQQHVPWLKSGPTIAFFAFTSTLVLSFLSFRYFESFFLRYKDRFTV